MRSVVENHDLSCQKTAGEEEEEEEGWGEGRLSPNGEKNHNDVKLQQKPLGKMLQRYRCRNDSAHSLSLQSHIFILHRFKT